MSTKDATHLEPGASNTNHTQVGEMIVVHCTDGIHNVANYEHGSGEVADHTYSVTAEHGCSCPAAKYHDGLCKHELAVLDAKTQDEDGGEPSITGAPHGLQRVRPGRPPVFPLQGLWPRIDGRRTPERLLAVHGINRGP